MKFFTVLMVLPPQTFVLCLFYFCIQTFFYFCFSSSWVRTAMTNSGERQSLTCPPQAGSFELLAFSATSLIEFLRFDKASIAEN